MTAFVKKPKGAHYQNQHYVPRAYLNRFAGPNAMLSVYDKVTDKQYRVRSEKVASAENFYTFPDDTIREDMRSHIDPDVIEKAFHAEEAQYQEDIDEVLRLIPTGAFPPELRRRMVRHVVFQYVRTPDFRKAVHETQTLMAQRKVQEMMGTHFPEADVALTPLAVVPEENALLAQNVALFDVPFLRELFRLLDNYIWIVGLNTTNKPFYTSDCPVSRSIARQETGPTQFGDYDTGIRYFLPLTPTVLLMLFERTHFEYLMVRDGLTLEVESEHVVQANQVQTMGSTRLVFASDGDFEVARAVCKQFPFLRDVQRPRIASLGEARPR